MSWLQCCSTRWWRRTTRRTRRSRRSPRSLARCSHRSTRSFGRSSARGTRTTRARSASRSGARPSRAWGIAGRSTCSTRSSRRWTRTTRGSSTTPRSTACFPPLLRGSAARPRTPTRSARSRRRWWQCGPSSRTTSRDWRLKSLRSCLSCNCKENLAARRRRLLRTRDSRTTRTALPQSRHLLLLRITTTSRTTRTRRSVCDAASCSVFIWGQARPRVRTGTHPAGSNSLPCVGILRLVKSPRL
mmetsp:Transcript_11636/g.38478  ORF Transcript_11636/g.38478 Transcript_11636/m.38478 type:complete len:244 (-) Transcript_11636:105-836(-)